MSSSLQYAIWFMTYVTLVSALYYYKHGTLALITVPFDAKLCTELYGIEVLYDIYLYYYALETVLIYTANRLLLMNFKFTEELGSCIILHFARADNFIRTW